MSINKKMVAFFFVMLFVSLIFIVKPVKADTIVKNGTLASNETWTSNNIYYINGDFTIPFGIELTISPGTIIKIVDNVRIFVNGNLTSVGETEKIIYFTSYKDDILGGDTNGDGLTFPAINDWGWIEFGPDSSGSFDYTTIRYSGNYNATYRVGAIFANNSNYKFPIVGDNVILENNAINGIHLPGGTIPLSTSKTLPNYPAAPYYLSGDLTIPFGSNLTLEPGSIFKLYNSVRIIVNGNFLSNGESEEIIYLTSYMDDYVGGDTNGDGLTSPSINDWGWIEFGPDSSGTINFTTLRYGGRIGATYRGGLLINGGSITVTQTIITKNNMGIEVNDAQAISIHTSSIYSNLAFGIKNNQSGIWVDATNNWWGHISGPLDTSSADGLYNPSGLGDKVTDYVDYYPWTTGINYTDFIYLPILLK